MRVVANRFTNNSASSPRITIVTLHRRRHFGSLRPGTILTIPVPSISLYIVWNVSNKSAHHGLISFLQFVDSRMHLDKRKWMMRCTHEIPRALRAKLGTNLWKVVAFLLEVALYCCYIHSQCNNLREIGRFADPSQVAIACCPQFVGGMRIIWGAATILLPLVCIVCLQRS